MSFWFGASVENLLFYGFDIHTGWGMFSTCLGLFSVTVLNEGLKSYRLHKARCNGQAKDEPAETMETEEISEPATERTMLLLSTTGRGHNSGSMSSVRRRRIVQENKDLEQRIGHFYLSVLYLVQTAVSYLIMLAVMSFNVWIMVAVVAGATLGHRIFDTHGSAHANVSTGNGNGGLRRESSIEVEERNVPESYGSVDSSGSVVVAEGGVLMMREDLERSSSVGDEGSTSSSVPHEGRQEQKTVNNGVVAIEEIVEVDVHAGGH